MKKLFALALALCLLCGCTALADNEITWDQVSPQLEAAGVTGDFVTFDEIAVKVFIPTGAKAAELSDEDKANGYIGYFTDESGDAIAVQYVNVDGMSLEDYKASLEGTEGVTELEAGTVNGLPCVSYEVPENGTINLAFTTAAGYILEVVCGPITDDNAKLGASFILASVQNID